MGSLERALSFDAGSRLTVGLSSRNISWRHQQVTAFDQLADFLPVQRCRVYPQGYPAMLANVRRAKKARILQKQGLQGLFDFDRNPKLALVLLKNGECFLCDLKRRMPEGDCLGRRGQPKTNLA